MIACLDVQYVGDKAIAAALVFSEWTATSSISEYTAVVPDPGEYEPGRFYLRELQPLLAVIQKITEPIDAYVIDGYCHLSSELAPGLGAYLWDDLQRRVLIVGVAKNRYRGTTHAAELLRAESKRPLFVTAVGIDYQRAAQHIASMAGTFRIPTLLKAVDRLARASENEQLGG